MSSKKKPSSTGPVWQLKITLKDSRPPIWRRILVAEDTSLAKLHRILQVTMGWWDCHLHQFTIHGQDYGVPDQYLSPFESRTENEKNAKLMAVVHGEKDRFVYEYDFGDDWLHHIVVEKIVPRVQGQRYPLCIAGARACPPEDCGGIWGYENFVKAIGDAKHPEHDHLLQWAGGGFEPEAFNLEWINEQLKRFK